MPATRANPHNLGKRGLSLFKSISVDRTFTEVELANLVEACRIADRLASLNELIVGDEDIWFRLKLPRNEDGVIEVLINDPMKEARLHAVTMRQLLAPFEAAKAADGAKKPEAEADVSPLEKKRQERQKRRSAAASS